MNREEKPLSENIGIYEAGEYILTSAIWRTKNEVGFFESYEIGIRHKKTGEFKLFQGDFDYQTVQDVANAMAHLLSIPTECYTPEWCMEHFK